VLHPKELLSRIAIDDDDIGWPDDKRDHLVHCPGERAGIGDQSVQADLVNKLTVRNIK
jgi:hypothetical protein